MKERRKKKEQVRKLPCVEGWRVDEAGRWGERDRDDFYADQLLFKYKTGVFALVIGFGAVRLSGERHLV